MSDRKESKFVKFIYFMLPIVSVLLLILGWVIVSGNNPNLLATPEAMWARVIKLFEKPINNITLLGHIYASLRRIFVSVTIAVILGVSLGLSIGWSKFAKSTMGTLFEFFRTIPPLAWVPMITVWFGIGELSKYILVFIGAVVPITVNTYSAVRMVDENLINVGKSFKATDQQIFRDIVLPFCMPAIFAGFRTSLGVGFAVVLAAEMLGARKGLGFLITRGMSCDDIALIMIGMIVIGVIGALLAVFTSWLERKACPWIEKIN